VPGQVKFHHFEDVDGLLPQPTFQVAEFFFGASAEFAPNLHGSLGKNQRCHGWCLPPKRKVLKNRTAQNMNKNCMFHGDRDYLRQQLCRNSWFYVHFQVNSISNAHTSQFLVKAHKLKSHVLVQ
jgi:hypothetical protein